MLQAHTRTKLLRKPCVPGTQTQVVGLQNEPCEKQLLAHMLSGEGTCFFQYSKKEQTMKPDKPE